jgi:hypothetical protein
VFDTAVLVAGCHGGAGTTTIARYLGARDGGVLRTTPTELADRTPIVLVCRATAWGTAEADRCITALAYTPGRAALTEVILIAVADGPWLEPVASKARLRVLSATVRVVRVPYVTAWRFTETPEPIPPRYAAALDTIADVLALIPRPLPAPAGRLVSVPDLEHRRNP